MATMKKGKGSSRELDKKMSKKFEEQTPITETETTAEEEKPDDEEPTEEVVEEPEIEKPPSPEPVYDEPILTLLIVVSYEGETEKGLYEGYGICHFVGGNEYRGLFKEGLMHGHGVFTWSDGTEYEGQFHCNKATGKGQYRWKDGSTYEGDVLNSRRHGVGCFRCPLKKMSYSGDWVNGKRHGKGRMEFDEEGRSFYEGDWVHNEKHGDGTRQYASGNVYQGTWCKNVREGEGTMHWRTDNQCYVGQWENGVPHGYGQHIWFLHRVTGSQYPLRNEYRGNFVHGLRQGAGTFYYANGARYEGQWEDNLKHGQGMFLFKNGRIYEGLFDKDHIAEYPNFTVDGVHTPDTSQIRTRTPLASEQLSLHSNASVNTIGPSFQIDVGVLLMNFTETERDEEVQQVTHVVLRHISSLRRVYSFYSSLGLGQSPDNTFILSRLQFWRMLKDCRCHRPDLTLTVIDRLIGSVTGRVEDQHEPHYRMLFREFVNNLVILAYHLYEPDLEKEGPVLASCLNRLMAENILPHACQVQGYIYNEPRRSSNALHHLDRALAVYQQFCELRKHHPHEPAMRMRSFLFMMKDLRLINEDLTATALVEVLAKDDPAVIDEDGTVNMELEMTFLEFFEALVGCAEVYVTEAYTQQTATPQMTTSTTREHSVISMSGSASRLASQAEDGLDADYASHTGDGISPMPRSASEITHGSQKQAEASHVTTESLAEVSDGQAVNSQKTHIDSAKKSEMSYKKSATPGSDAAHAMVQSLASVGALLSEGGVQTELGDDDQDGLDEEEEEVPDEVDENTRRFNFWTFQLHFFFVRKFFHAAKDYLFYKERMNKRSKDDVTSEVHDARSVVSAKSAASSHPPVTPGAALSVTA